MSADQVSSSSSGKTEGSPKQASFEDSLHRLHDIVERLEGGELSLDDSLKLFEEGIRLARTSQARLDAAEKRVEELLEIDERGNPVVRELEVE
jgi:exodeoxyribonuclease VII small subunit